MKYQHTTNLITRQIAQLRTVIEQRKKDMEDPEMEAVVVFAENDILMAEHQIKEHQAALEILMKNNG